MSRQSMKNKHSVIVIAAVSLLASAASHAVTVFENDTSRLDIGGRVEFRGDFSDNTEGTMDNKSRFRLNLDGETVINDQLTAFAFYEAEQSVSNTGASNPDNQANEFNQRYMYAGISSEFGAISFGRQDTAIVLISGMSDLGILNNNQKIFIKAGNEQINNTIAYALDVDALQIRASYIASEEEKTDGAAVSALYELPVGLSLGLGFATNNNGVEQGKGNQIIAGANYSANAFSLGATYTKGDLDDKAKAEFKGTEIAAEYRFTPKFRLIAAYIDQEEKLDENSRYTIKNDFYELTARYDLASNVRAYVTYKADQRKEVKDIVRLGLRYDF